MAIGGSAGYLTVNPTQDYVGQALQGASESFARVRAEKIAQERDRMTNEENLREQRRRDFKDAMEINEKYPYAALGDNDKQFVVDLKKTYTDAMRDYLNTGNEKSQALADKSISNLNRLNESKKAMSIKAEEMLKNEQDYNPTSFNKVKELVARVNKDLITRLDENGNVINDLVKRNEDGNIIGVEKKGITDAELKQMFEIVPKFNIIGDKGLIEQFKKPLKLTEKEDVIMTPKGEMLRKTKGFEGYENTAATTAKELTKNKSAVYTALDALGEDPEKKDNYTNDDILKKVESYYNNILLDSAKPSVAEVPYLEREKFSHQKTKDAENLAVAKGNLAVSQQRANYDMSEKTETSKIKLTPEGEKARQADIKKYGVAYPLSTYEHTTTRKTVSTKSNSNPSASKPNAKPTPAKKEINRSEIASKAKAAGYSLKEYEALLIKNGVTIK
jgi:hypothetical protein